MKSAAVILVLAMLVSVTALLVAGDSCDNVPTVTWSGACLKVCATPSMYNLCQETLQHAPDAAKVTVYALEAEKIAWQSYEATETEAVRQLLYGSLPGDERAAYERCIFMYAAARSSMAAVMNYMFSCEFKRAIQESDDLVTAVESCAEALSSFQHSSLVAMNAADRDLTTVALDLGSLIAGRGS